MKNAQMQLNMYVIILPGCVEVEFLEALICHFCGGDKAVSCLQETWLLLVSSMQL